MVVILALCTGVLFLNACVSNLPPIQFSLQDKTTAEVGDKTNYGSRVHYYHSVRDANGNLQQVYRYYRDRDGKSVLDGDRLIYRFEHDPGIIYVYREGKIVAKEKVIFR